MSKQTMLEKRQANRERRKGIEVLREDKKATYDEPDGETGSDEVVEPDGTQPDG